MTDRDALAARLDAVEEEITEPTGFDFTVNWVDPDDSDAETGGFDVVINGDPDREEDR